MELSKLERFTLSWAPRWTLKRFQTRLAVRNALRHYDAASPGRRTSGWARSAGDADLLVRGALLELRMHARDLIRNNSWARRAQRVIANNTAGWGIVPKAVHASPTVAQKAQQLWKTWAESTECESEDRHTFYGIQALCMRAIAQDGEVLIRRRYRRPKDKLSIPLQLQVLEADYLDQSKNFPTSDSGGPVIQGVEFDLLGRRSAYWIFPEHPGSGRNYRPSVRISAEEILHIYYTERPQQSRGISWFGSAIVNLKDLDEYEDAELMKQKIAACFAAFVTDPDGAAGTMGVDGTDTSNGQPIESLEPGQINYLAPGKEVTFGNPPTVTNDNFTNRVLRRVAAGLGVTFEDLTGDYSQVNFSSARMARIAHWKNVHDWQMNMLIPLLCRGVWDWAMSAAQLAGEIPLGDAPVATWTPPPMPMIEPDKEGLAYQRLIRNGLMSLSEAIREQGNDPESHLAEIAADNAQLDALGIVLDSDPRKTTTQGQEQISVTADSAPDESPQPKKKPGA